MSMDQLLAIDIGNTHIKLGLFQDGQWRQEWRLSTEVKRTADEYRLSLRGLLAEAGVERVKWSIIGSVVPLLTPIFLRVADTLTDTVPMEVSPPGYGLAVDYVPPDSLGADRFVNALAAWQKYRVDLVVVDVGTTATIDAVSGSGRFLGGTIAPGPHFLVRALAEGTARLPHILPVIPEQRIGHSTQEAIAVGVGHGFIGMVNALIARTRSVLGAAAPVILTGGWAGRIQAQLATPVRLEPLLTLEGLRYAARWTVAAKTPQGELAATDGEPI